MNINNISTQNFRGSFAQAYKGLYLMRAFERKIKPQFTQNCIEKPLNLNLAALPNIQDKTIQIKNNCIFSPCFEFFARLF